MLSHFLKIQPPCLTLVIVAQREISEMFQGPRLGSGSFIPACIQLGGVGSVPAAIAVMC